MKSVVIHYQEIALKGKNRPWFVARLVKNIKEATKDLDIKEVRALMGRIELVLGPTATWEGVRDRVALVFGVGNFAKAGRARGRGLDSRRPGRRAPPRNGRSGKARDLLAGARPAGAPGCDDACAGPFPGRRLDRDRTSGHN